MPISYNLRVGQPDTTHDAPSHVSGTRQGNSTVVKDPGISKVGGKLKTNARRSTGINAAARNPITPGAPNLSPA